jgi:hypothetical protein
MYAGRRAAGYGMRIDSWRLPAAKTKRAQLAAAYGSDGFTLLEAVYAPDSPPWLAQLPAVQTLRRVLVQHYVVVVDRQGREVITMRDAETHGLPPGRCRITSPYDLDARYGGKRDLLWNGYKLHISETCDAEPATGPATGDDDLATGPRRHRLRRAAFTIDWDHQQAVCPHGQASISWAPAAQRGTEVIVVRFDRRTCAGCPVKTQCTTATRTGRG